MGFIVMDISIYRTKTAGKPGQTTNRHNHSGTPLNYRETLLIQTEVFHVCVTRRGEVLRQYLPLQLAVQERLPQARRQ